MNPTTIYVLMAAAAIVVLLVVVAAVLRFGRRRPPAGNPYVEALRRLVDEDRDAAFVKLQEAVRTGTAPVDAYIKLGELLRERGQAGKALQLHQSLTVKATLSREEKIALFMNLAADHAELGNWQKAAAVLETAIRSLNVRDPDVYRALAEHHRRVGANERAYEVLRDARKLGGVSEDELALFLASAAEQLVTSGDLREARKLLQRALKHDPDCAPALVVLGDLCEESGDLNEAISHWKRAAILSPVAAEGVLAKLERILFESGRFSEIERIYDEVRASRWDEAATLALARFYRKQERGDDAINLLEEFLTVHPDSVRGALLLAALYAKYRDTATLEDFLERSIRDSGAPSASQQESFRDSSARSKPRYQTFTRRHAEGT